MYFPRNHYLILVTFLGTTLTLLEAASHGHHDEQDDGSIELAKVVQDIEHMKEHMEGKAKLDVDKMSANERAFHYFQEHDTNDDNHLDGLELMNSILHVFAHSAHANNMVANIQATIDRVAMTIDNTLFKRDANNDGYLSYTEYMSR